MWYHKNYHNTTSTRAVALYVAVAAEFLILELFCDIL